MAEARQESQWAQTAEILCMLYNAHRSPHARPRKAAEFHPFAAAEPRHSQTADLRILRDVFVREGG